MFCIYIALDDTDSMEGGCTTYLLTRALEICRDSGYTCLFLPGLVRLNPNIPYKTRGNGAVVFYVSRRMGDDNNTFCSGAIGNEPMMSIWSDDEHRAPDHEPQTELFQKLKRLIDEESSYGHENTNPGLVVSSDTFGLSNYERAVRAVYPLEMVLGILDRKMNTLYHGLGSMRGLVGCLGALSWYQNYRSKGLDHTYEMICYRKPEFWGTKRDVKPDFVRSLDLELPGSFNNYDLKNDKPLIYPNTPCPVLFGVRGNDYHVLPRALEILETFEMERWQLFVTNQGTDDHLVPTSLGKIENYASVITEGTVLESSFTIKGGHVFIRIGEGDNSIYAAAFEPTKSFRKIVRGLLPGDRVRVFGGVKGDEKAADDGWGKMRPALLDGFARVINLEKLELIDKTHRLTKISNPICPSCKTKMKSLGKGVGYRCRKCRFKAAEKDADYGELPRTLVEGKTYEVDGVAMRHLSKPLVRIGREKGRSLTEIDQINY